jgi:sulfite reductase alpha subunit-like flavoprotein
VHVYVCGDGASMAKDVHAVLISILESMGSLSTSDATAFLAAMTKQQRYVRDIWS